MRVPVGIKSYLLDAVARCLGYHSTICEVLKDEMRFLTRRLVPVVVPIQQMKVAAVVVGCSEPVIDAVGRFHVERVAARREVVPPRVTRRGLGRNEVLVVIPAKPGTEIACVRREWCCYNGGGSSDYRA